MQEPVWISFQPRSPRVTCAQNNPLVSNSSPIRPRLLRLRDFDGEAVSMAEMISDVCSKLLFASWLLGRGFRRLLKVLFDVADSCVDLFER